MMTRSAATGLVALALAVAVCDAYSSGAPPEACSTMLPGHGTSPRSTPLPYNVTLSPTVAAPGQTVSLVISSIGGSGPLKGLFVQARDAADPDVPKALGTFVATEDTKVIDCSPGKANAVTHKDSSNKERVEVQWQVPQDVTTSVVFRVTAVQSHPVFWVGHDSALLRVTRDVGTTASPPEPTAEPTPEPAAEPEPTAEPTPEPSAGQEAQSHGEPGTGAGTALAPATVLTLVGAAVLRHVQ